MASQLSERDRLLLNAYQDKKVGEKPYENGVWSEQGSDDFAYLEVYDDSNNLIDFRNLGLDKFSINTNSSNITFYIGDHLRDAGFNNGTYNVRYRFFRKLAGDERAVLVRNKAPFEGDVWTQQFNIRPDGKVYTGTEEEFINNPTIAEQLSIEDLKYQIDEVSPNRTEVRLKAKKIKGNYEQEFINIQTATISTDVPLVVNFQDTTGNGQASALFDSNIVSISPEEGGFLFTSKMKDGTLTIPNVFKVNEIEVPVKTTLNALENPDFELTERDTYGNEVTLGDRYGWDSSLHSKAVLPTGGWHSGFTTFSESSPHFQTEHIGYYSHFVRGEGVNGGVCLKFPDTNSTFTALDEWPTDSPSRWMATTQKLLPLSSQGVTNGDFVNLAMDLKGSVVGRGVSVRLRYPTSPVTEEAPTLPPTGYYNPDDPAPSEENPGQNNPPENYVANTSANANNIEVQPPPKYSDVQATYLAGGGSNIDPPLPMDIGVGDTTEFWGGEGAWIIESSTGGTNPIFNWQPNLNKEPYNQAGTLSEGEQWLWNGTQWITNPAYASPYPTAPDGTVSLSEFPNAVNAHPYQLEGNGNPYFKRTSARGENSGWTTATNVGSDGSSLLFKDDLIWKQKHSQDNLEDYEFYIFDEYFPGLRTTLIDGKPLYNDIFENGFLQAVERVSEGEDEGIRPNWYIIFYNNGDKDSNGEFTEESNRYFYIDRTSGPQTRQDKIVHFLKDIAGETPVSLNDKVLENQCKFETAINYTNDGKVRYYFFVDDEYYAKNDGDDKGNLTNGGMDGPTAIQEGFGNVPTPIDAAIGKKPGYGRYRYIVGNQIYRSKGTTSDGVESAQDINENNFYECGVLGRNAQPLVYGSRNPAADNYNPDAIYDDDSSEFSFDTNPKKIGTLSPGELWKWNGDEWIPNAVSPPRFNYQSVWSELISVDQANVWERKEVSLEIPDNWLVNENYFVMIYGHTFNLGNTVFGISWVDNLYMDFTLTEQSTTREVFRPFTAQITDVSGDGTFVTLDRSYKQCAIDIGVDDEDPETEVYDISNPPDQGFPEFRVSYLNLNPLDLRTYLKFENRLFLTTNFKQDKINVGDYPHSVVYKLYEPLPEDLSQFDECVVVKEMASPINESVKIVDFVPAEEGKLVLRSPDLANVESPIRSRMTDFKNENEILTDDATISEELKNEFLSQSLDSVELNIDYRRYENFAKFSSVNKRIRNFRTKLQQIEDYNSISSSFIGISGSAGAIASAENSIREIKNNFDGFEKYMYFESSSYDSGSLGIFYDNAWPKASGNGTLRSPYVLETVSSTNAVNWFNKATESGSLYDTENSSRLSSLLPEHIKENLENEVFLRFTDMIGQHFDSIWVYINAITDTFDRREKLSEGISKDLLYSVGRSLGWTLDDGKDLINLPKFALGKEVTGSAYSDYSVTPERDISREIWSRIINNMPFFLKNKGTVRALKGLINIYGIPSTILRVKEYGGPDLEDDASPQFEITRKFTKALDFKGEQYVKAAWANDTESGRKPDTIEFRFRAASGSNQILVNKDKDFILRLKDNNSVDNRGHVSFMLSGSEGYREVSSSVLPVYDGDFYSVMITRTSGSDSVHISQSYELNVGKYDSSRSKIHLFTSNTMTITGSIGGYNGNYTSSGDFYIGGEETISSSADGIIGVPLTGSIMEYRHWTETLNTSSFKNHIANPKAYDGNTVSSSYNNLVLRYSFDDNKDLTSDTEGIRDVSSNQTATVSGSHNGFTGNFFRSVVDEQKTHIPSIGALRRTTNKIRIESNNLKPNENLSPDKRSTESAYDTAPLDSNKVGIFFAPTDVINNDIINSVGNLNFDNYLGDPRDQTELKYRGLERVADNYWKKYTAPNNFWDYIRLLKYYDQSLYPQLRKMIPARAKPDIGLLIEPNIFERPKVIIGRKPVVEQTHYSSSINIGDEQDGLIIITGSYNHGSHITDYNAYDGNIEVFSYTTSSFISSSGEDLLKEATGSEARDRFLELRLWQRINKVDKFYATSSIVKGDIHYSEVKQPIISGSRIYGRNQKTMPFYSSSLSASLFIAYSSSFYNVDLDNRVEEQTALFRRIYSGVKNTNETTIDGAPPIEVIITAPSKLVSVKDGESTLKTGEGIVSKFKEKEDEKDKNQPKVLDLPVNEDEIKVIEGLPKPKPTPLNPKGEFRGLKGLNKKKIGTKDRPITDAMIKRQKQEERRKKIAEESKFESTANGKGASVGNKTETKELEK